MSSYNPTEPEYHGPDPLHPSHESSPPLVLGPGLTLRFFATPSASASSPYKRYTETTYEPVAGDDAASAPLSVPAHWHALHDEHLSVLEGALDLTLGTGAEARVVELRPGMEPAVAPRRTVHAMKGKEGVRTVLREGTSYQGERTKEEFLRHIFAAEWSKYPLLPLRASAEGDTYAPLPVLGYRSEVLEMVVTIALGTVAKLFAPAKPPLPSEDAFAQKKA